MLIVAGCVPCAACVSVCAIVSQVFACPCVYSCTFELTTNCLRQPSDNPLTLNPLLSYTPYSRTSSSNINTVPITTFSPQIFFIIYCEVYIARRHHLHIICKYIRLQQYRYLYNIQCTILLTK